MVSRSCSNIRDDPNIATEFISDIRTGTAYINVASEFISDSRTGTTYPNVITEFISDI
jgi:hypothetical protein